MHPTNSHRSRRRIGKFQFNIISLDRNYIINGVVFEPERTIPKAVQRPLLPAAHLIMPYLSMIDESRVYSNRGSLVTRLEMRISKLFGSQDLALVTTTSGSSAIEAGILAHAGRACKKRPIAVVPGYTFAGTAHSAIRCGYDLLVMDVDPDTWTLDPEQVKVHPDFARVGLVVPVAPHGCRPDIPTWETFQLETGRKVVIDAAASFEQFASGRALASNQVPVALSFHATKAFSSGEGGGVLCTDYPTLERVGRITNFGFDENRTSVMTAINGKMSEYQAAVGHAALDQWEERSACLQSVSEHYQNSLQNSAIGHLLTLPDIGGTYTIFDCTDQSVAKNLADRLTKNDIPHRFWYGLGLHMHSAFASAQFDPLPVTEDISSSHLGLPTAPDMDPDIIEKIAGMIY